jgi:uncharacterized membrane protein YbhN (UPF0104 family)
MLFFAICLWAVGATPEISLLVVAYGIAMMVGLILITPGGYGGFEPTMVMVLMAGNVSGPQATSGVLLARVIVLLLTLLSGWATYYHAVKKYGKPKMDPKHGV